MFYLANESVKYSKPTILKKEEKKVSTLREMGTERNPDFNDLIFRLDKLYHKVVG